MELVAALQEGGEVHLERSGDVVEGDPLAWSEPHELITRVAMATYSS